MRKILLLMALLATLAASSEYGLAQTDTTFTYQGDLRDGGMPADGLYDFQFSLWSSLIGGGQAGSTLFKNNVPVSGGKFNVQLDFGGAALNNFNRYLQIVVEGTTLTPRQPITRTPYAMQVRGLFVNDDKSFVGVGRVNPVTTAESFGTYTPTSGFGGMYVQTFSSGEPFYGYSAGGDVDAFHYYDSATDQWALSINGDRLVVNGSNGNVGIGTISPVYKLSVFGGSTPAIFGNSNVTGVWGATTASTTYAGVFGQHPNGTSYGVYASGNMGASGTKSFRIDHPLDPAYKYLLHYCAEAPEPLNVYSGTIELDGSGAAWVELPDYFELINRDVRYQLTCVGGYANVYVADEVEDNRFRIAGGEPGLKVSWEVKGVRDDRWVRENGAPTELDKPAESQGKYLHPQLYGMPQEFGEHPLPAVTADTLDDPSRIPQDILADRNEKMRINLGGAEE